MHPRGVRADGVSAYIWQVALPWRGLPSQHRRAARHLGYTSRAWDEELEIHGDRGEMQAAGALHYTEHSWDHGLTPQEVSRK